MRNSKYARYELDQSPLYRLQSKKKLFKVLYVSSKKIRSLSQATKLYSEGSANGRSIEKPRADLKGIQKRIEDLLKRISMPEFIYAPAKGKSYISNACAHIGAQEVRCLDIAAYFQSTSSRRVFWFFNKLMECSPDVAGILTEVLTLDGRLPTGSPSSPIISYFSHQDMWKEIGRLVQDYQCTLSVYVDDVTISGDKVPKVLAAKLKKILNQYGLKSKGCKEKYYRHPTAFEVTGVIVQKDGFIGIPRRQHKKIYELRQLMKTEDDEYQGYKLALKLHGCETQKKQVERHSCDHITIPSPGRAS